MQNIYKLKFLKNQLTYFSIEEKQIILKASRIFKLVTVVYSNFKIASSHRRHKLSTTWDVNCQHLGHL